MKKTAVLLVLLLLLVAVLATAHDAAATPSEELREVKDDIVDDWGITRTRAVGVDGFYQVTETGFRPVIVFEGLGEEADLAFSLGEQMAAQYPDLVQRAEKIFQFARNRVTYTSDADQFQRDEFAQNADEVAATIEADGRARGDCEDSAILLAVMYRGAGFRSAITVAPGHTAAMVYLPEYDKTTDFILDGEPGWVWAEATGARNPLGWVPKEFIDAEIAAYEVSAEAVDTAIPQNGMVTAVTTGGGGGGGGFSFPFFGVIGFLWFLSLFRRRRPR
jgi:hypothetical protein